MALEKEKSLPSSPSTLEKPRDDSPDLNINVAGEALNALGEADENFADTPSDTVSTTTSAKPSNFKTSSSQSILLNPPSASIMQKQIRREIIKEIQFLEKRAKIILSSSNRQKHTYFELNNIVKKIRELKRVLLSLMKASYDSLKALWTRYVHGIM